MMPRPLHPPGWPRPRGHANGMAAKGTLVVTGGQSGRTPDGRFAAEDLVGQFHQALKNVTAVLATANAWPQHVVRLTCHVTDIQAYRDNLESIGAAYRDVMGDHYPAMALAQVVSLLEPEALVEIEATAVVPDELPS